ncbi:MAG: ImmA/IrrE family metallo-endopeptidase [Candidatus Paceibacterota bacterium]|jgi:Zn-dependent peptidase ImmA (M78 family)
MIIPTEWKIYARNKVNEILSEVSGCLTIKTSVPIKSVVESYLGDVNIVTHISDELGFPDGVSAFSTKDMNNGWIIAINGRECVERQRFSLAHELAHIVLNLQAKKVYCSTNGNGWDEQLCDQFAGDILMPENIVRTMYQSNPKPFIGDVAKAFKVSRPVAEIQLRRLNLPFKLYAG